METIASFVFTRDCPLSSPQVPWLRRFLGSRKLYTYISFDPPLQTPRRVSRLRISPPLTAYNSDTTAGVARCGSAQQLHELPANVKLSTNPEHKNKNEAAEARGHGAPLTRATQDSHRLSTASAVGGGTPAPMNLNIRVPISEARESTLYYYRDEPGELRTGHDPRHRIHPSQFKKAAGPDPCSQCSIKAGTSLRLCHKFAVWVSRVGG